MNKLSPVLILNLFVLLGRVKFNVGAGVVACGFASRTGGNIYNWIIAAGMVIFANWDSVWRLARNLTVQQNHRLLRVQFSLFMISSAALVGFFSFTLIGKDSNVWTIGYSGMALMFLALFVMGLMIPLRSGDFRCRCGYDLYSLPCDSEGVTRCPECGELARASL